MERRSSPNEPASRIRANVHRILASIPRGVTLLAAVKGRSPDEVRAAVGAGITHLGANYVQQAEALRPLLSTDLTWHLIGHLQSNKASKAVALFDLVETVDSQRIALRLDRLCGRRERVLSVLIEVNSAREDGKTGVLPEALEPLVESIARLDHLRLRGLMTMGPAGDTDAARRCFRDTRRRYDALRRRSGVGAGIDTLSMGMSDSYLVAIEEGATEVRLGRALFAPLPPSGP